MRALHVILTSESAGTRAFTLSLRRLRLTVGGVAALLLLAFGFGTLGITNLSTVRTQQQRIAAMDQQLTALDEVNRAFQDTISVMREEHATRLADALTALNTRSADLEAVLTQVGVLETEEEGGTANTGGPYQPLQVGEIQATILRADSLLRQTASVPLGLPFDGAVITSRFGVRKDPFTGRRALHNGVDLRGEMRAPVRATADGIVTEVGYARRGYGHYVRIWHEDGEETLFGHLAKVSVHGGEAVSRGDVIGLLGNSGRSTGPHLHYEIRRDGRAVDPVAQIWVGELLNHSNHS
jgi:murein DD-endopeptidase MepM/ murein hydrolase activator NlpD